MLDYEAAGLALPLNANIFDQFPIVSNDHTADIADCQYPKLLKQLVLPSMVRSTWTVKPSLTSLG